MLAAGCVAFALSAPRLAHGEDGELARLRQEAVDLRQALESVEARIRVLETRDPADPGESAQAVSQRGNSAPAAQNAPAAMDALVTLKRNWSQVVPGITREEVQALLGAPGNVLRIDGTPVWYYAYPGIGRGSVFFREDGTVSSRQAPPLGW
jgi:hypothetical protein